MVAACFWSAQSIAMIAANSVGIIPLRNFEIVQAALLRRRPYRRVFFLKTTSENSFSKQSAPCNSEFRNGTRVPMRARTRGMATAVPLRYQSANKVLSPGVAGAKPPNTTKHLTNGRSPPGVDRGSSSAPSPFLILVTVARLTGSVARHSCTCEILVNPLAGPTSERLPANQPWCVTKICTFTVTTSSSLPRASYESELYCSSCP
jgi:hypothetical protein